MNLCPITYLPCSDERYSVKGLHRLSNKLQRLELFPYTQEEQITEATSRASKISIQGVQPKLSTRLNIKNSVFEVVDRKGIFILKPQNLIYRELPQNEDLTMRLAEKVGLDIPLHGMVYSKDLTLTYFIKRFDRTAGGKKYALEDFAQLAGESRETKYDYSMEKIINIIDEYCTFPAIDKLKLFRMVIFNFLTGNEDMHLKNYSLISKDMKVELSPCYDLINTTIAIENVKEEIALPIAGKKKNLNRKDLVDYYGNERLNLNSKVINDTLKNFTEAAPAWNALIKISFLSSEMKKRYLELISLRKKILNV
jgi:serine/threonine-protein kinase HipA